MVGDAEIDAVKERLAALLRAAFSDADDVTVDVEYWGWSALARGLRIRSVTLRWLGVYGGIHTATYHESDLGTSAEVLFACERFLLGHELGGQPEVWAERIRGLLPTIPRMRATE